MTDLALPANHPPLNPSADAADILRLLAADLAALPHDAGGQPIVPPGWWKQQQQQRPHCFARSATDMSPAEFAAAKRTLRYAGLAPAEDQAAAANLQRTAARQASRPWRRGVA